MCLDPKGIVSGQSYYESGGPLSITLRCHNVNALVGEVVEGSEAERLKKRPCQSQHNYAT